MAKKAEDFVGRRSTMTPEGRRADRLQLVGLASANEQEMLPVGAHVVPAGPIAPPIKSEGWVTSSVMSPSLRRPVALGLVARGRSRGGETVSIYDARLGRTLIAKIVEPAAYDPKGERLHG
jgi:sarcosine oxidase subunit alpha